MYIDKQTFFNDRQLPTKNYYYRYDNIIYQIASEDVINSISTDDKNAIRCLFILSKLTASNEFLLNVYLQDLADDLMEKHIRKEIRKNITERVFNGEKVIIALTDVDGNKIEYSAYKDDNHRFHFRETDQKYETRGVANFHRFVSDLSLDLKSFVFNEFERIDESEINN